MNAHKKLSAAVIAGIAVGALALIIIAIAGPLAWRRFKKQNDEEYQRRIPTFIPQPFHYANEFPPMASFSSAYGTTSAGISQSTLSSSTSKKSQPTRTPDPAALPVLSGVPRQTPPAVIQDRQPRQAAFTSNPTGQQDVPVDNRVGGLDARAPDPPHQLAQPNNSVDIVNRDIAAVEGLLHQLNRALARLPPGAVEDEAPPEYRTS